MAPGEINLTFEDGMLFHRMAASIEGKSPGRGAFQRAILSGRATGLPQGDRHHFMIAAMIKGEVDPEDVRRFFRALRKAQRDIDLRPELLHALLQERIPGSFPCRHGYAALGSGRADRIRDLFAGSLRAIVRLDRGARDICRRAHGDRANTIDPRSRLLRSSTTAMSDITAATTPRRSHPARPSAPPGPAAGSAAI